MNRYFFEAFKPSPPALGWSSVILFRRAILSAVNTVLSAQLRYMGFAIASIGFAVVHIVVNPFRDQYVPKRL